MKTNIADHSEVMSLLGKKLGFMENINHFPHVSSRFNNRERGTGIWFLEIRNSSCRGLPPSEELTPTPFGMSIDHSKTM